MKVITDKDTINIISIKLSNQIKNGVNFRLIKNQSNSDTNKLNEYYETNIMYRGYLNIGINIFIESNKLFICLNADETTTLIKFGLDIPGGYKKNLNKVDTFIQECANKILEDALILRN